MSKIVNDIRTGFFLDSVALMRISRTVAGLDGVEEAALMMGTPTNKNIMRDAGLLADEGEAASGGDLVLGVRADNDAAANAALAHASVLLTAPKTNSDGSTQWQPRSLRAAISNNPEANLALISVPGDFAAAEARKAIRRGLHTMIFSDNVPVADERALKEEARDLGVLVMGPDCGTAVVGGTPLAFANVLKQGNIGIIGASGTGIQEVSCLVDRFGGGISHAIGVGGRDLSEEIGGITTQMAIEAFEEDPATQQVILISKPPSASVTARIMEQIAASKKKYTVCLIGAASMKMPANAHQVTTLQDAASQTVFGSIQTSGDNDKDIPILPEGRKDFMGLFCGGTLSAEAQLIFQEGGISVSSNAPVPGVSRPESTRDLGSIIDLGADEFTRGRPHPMIDPTVREDVLTDALRQPELGLILIDVIIGHGAHDDPADSIVKCLATLDGERPIVIGSVTGTEGDPQIRSSQVAKLEAAGVKVASSNAEASRLAVTCLQRNN